MNDKPKILLVEDDDIAAVVTADMLDSDYDVLHVDRGQAALDQLSRELPDLVLLDVAMPGMSGYEVCRALRDNPEIGDLPVIFLSGMVSEEDRLAGYEAGGDDYLTKPVLAEELRSKVRVLLDHYIDRSRLKSDLSNAFSTAMTAMSSAAEIGAVLQFLQKSASCPDYAALGGELLNTLGSFGMEACVQIRGQQQMVSVGASGPCSPLEESVLANMAGYGRLFEFSGRISCSYEHVTLIVRSPKQEDPERHGRMKDILAQLAEGANVRVAALDNMATVVRQNAAFEQVAASARKALQSIDQRHREQAARSTKIFDELLVSFDRSMLTLGITQSQEEELANMILEAGSKAKALYDEGLETGAHMESILEQLGSVCSPVRTDGKTS